MSDIRKRLLDAGEFPGSKQLGISDYCALCDEAADEIDKLRDAVKALAAIVQWERRHHIGGERYNRFLAEYDAALALADAALGNDVERAA